MMMGKTPDPESIAFVIGKIKPELDLLETCLGKKGKNFLVSDHVSIADLQLYYTCTAEAIWGRNFDAYPAITAWMKRMREIKEVDEIMTTYDGFVTVFKAKLSSQ